MEGADRTGNKMKKTLKYFDKTIEIPEDITRTIKKKLILRTQVLMSNIFVW